MKRLITSAMALILAAGLASAVDSGNEVGYQTLDITGGNFNMVAVQWDEVGGGDLDIQAIFSDPLGAGLQGGSIYSGNVLGADLLKVWNPATSGYASYYLYDSGGAYAGWDGQWIDDSVGIPAVAAFPKGSTCWLLSHGSSTSVISAGEVPQVGAVTNAMTAGNFNMIANPYPTPYELNGAYAPDLLAAGAQGGSIYSGNVLDADLLKVWNPATSGYASYYLYDSGGAYAGWDGQWIDDSVGIPATASLSMGQPAWYQSKGGAAFDFVFTKPY